MNKSTAGRELMFVGKELKSNFEKTSQMEHELVSRKVALIRRAASNQSDTN